MAMDKKRWMALAKDVSPTYLIILYGVLVLALGLVLSSDENRADRNAAILYYSTAFLHCIYY